MKQKGKVEFGMGWGFLLLQFSTGLWGQENSGVPTGNPCPCKENQVCATKQREGVGKKRCSRLGQPCLFKEPVVEEMVEKVREINGTPDDRRH